MERWKAFVFAISPPAPFNITRRLRQGLGIHALISRSSSSRCANGTANRNDSQSIRVTSKVSGRERDNINSIATRWARAHLIGVVGLYAEFLGLAAFLTGGGFFLARSVAPEVWLMNLRFRGAMFTTTEASMKLVMIGACLTVLGGLAVGWERRIANSITYSE